MPGLQFGYQALGEIRIRTLQARCCRSLGSERRKRQQHGKQDQQGFHHALALHEAGNDIASIVGDQGVKPHMR